MMQDLLSLLSERITRGKIVNLELILNSHCNLRCRYCFEGDRTQIKKLMTSEIGRKALDRFFPERELFRRRLVFFGGEPLLNWETLKALTEYARSKFVDDESLGISVTTNGTILPTGAASFFNHQKISVLCSLDLTEGSHDYNRKTINGRKTYNIIMKNIVKLIDHGVHVSARTSLVPLAYYDFDNTYEALGKVGIKNWLMGPVTSENWSAESLCALEDGLFRLWKRYRSGGYGPGLSFLTDIWQGNVFRPCYAGEKSITVDPDGYLYGCSRLATTSASDGTLPLGRLCQSNINNQNVDMIRRSTLAGSCPAENVVETGDLFTQSKGRLELNGVFHRLHERIK
ncbi:MAG: radical SAM protein [Azospirillum sp.]|nr:radical SAM protein [Azospirillum sp.]